MDKSIDQMNATELREALAEYGRSLTPQAQAPHAPGFGPGYSQLANETAATLYGESLMRRPASSLSAQEREFLRQSIAHCLKTEGQ